MMGMSIVLSFVVWVLIQITQPANVRYLKVPVQIFNEEQLGNNVVAGHLDMAWVQIVGSEDIMSRAIEDVRTRGVVAVYVDLSSAHPGIDDYPLRLSKLNQNLPYDVSLSDTNIQVTLEPKGRVEIPVTIQETGRIPSDKNLVLDHVDAKPSMAVVEGASSAVRSVKRLTAMLDLSQVESAMAVFPTVEAFDANGQRVEGVTISPKQVQLSVAVAPAAQSQTVLIEPVMTGHPAMGYEVVDFVVEPTQIAVQGPPQILARLRKVSTQPINLAGLRESTSFEKELVLPPNVKSYSVKSVQIKITVRPKEVTSAVKTDSPTVTVP